MQAIIRYIRSYVQQVDKTVWLLVTLLTAGLVFCNYYFEIDGRISSANSFSTAFMARYGIFLFAFVSPYILYVVVGKRKYFTEPLFIFLLLLAPAIFSLKIALNVPVTISPDSSWNHYWNLVLYWPALLIILSAILFILWKSFYKQDSFFGFTFQQLNWKPYLVMLLFMLPLMAAASTQPDFLAMYPKIKMITGGYKDPGFHWWHKILFELSYGSDFIGIELFFRGFLILAFMKWVGKDAILPMACFYCTIHFGKPAGECISSYFGGILLGIIVSHTRSIFGGLIVHLGIAWMMELGGYLGNMYLQN
jgi:hypothetical protein